MAAPTLLPCSAKGLRLVKGRCIKPQRPTKRCRKGYRLVKGGKCIRIKPVRKPVKQCRKGYRLAKGGRCVRIPKRG